MNKKLLSLCTVAVAAMVALSPVALAQSPVKQYKDQLATKVGTKSGTSASKAAASVLGKFSKSDPAKLVSFVKLGQKTLKSLIKSNAVGKSVQTQVKKFAGAYFVGLKKYDPNDSKFQKAIQLLVSKMPSSQKSIPVLTAIYNELNAVNNRNGGTGAQRQALADLVFGAGGKTPPNVS